MDHIERTVAGTGSDSMGRREITREPERYAVPPVDIYEREDGLVVVADLPGVGSDGLSVQVEQGVLTIEGKQSREALSETLSREFVLAPFFRQFRVAEQIDTARIRATLRNGVLTLELPRAEQAKPRQIRIET